MTTSGLDLQRRRSPLATWLLLVGLPLSVLGAFLPLGQAGSPFRYVNLDADAQAWFEIGAWIVLWFFGRVIAAAVAAALLPRSPGRIAAGALAILGSSLLLDPLSSILVTTFNPADAPALGAVLLAIGGALVISGGLVGIAERSGPAPGADLRLATVVGLWGTAAAAAYILTEVVFMFFEGVNSGTEYLFLMEPLGLAALVVSALMMWRGGRSPDVATGLVLGGGIAFVLRFPILLLPSLLSQSQQHPKPLDWIPSLPAFAAGVLLLWAGGRAYRAISSADMNLGPSRA